jgi:hypothetical protein
VDKVVSERCGDDGYRSEAAVSASAGLGMSLLLTGMWILAQYCVIWGAL